MIRHLISPILALALCVLLSAHSSLVAQDSSAPQPPSFRSMAVSAVNDLLGHFWVGDAETGHIVDTFGGFGGNLKPPDEQGILWERATLLATIEDLHEITKDSKPRQRIAADWAWVKKRHTPEQLEACGSGSRNPAHDDAGW